MAESEDSELEAHLEKVRARRKVTREMLERARARTEPAITDADIEALFEQVRRQLGPPKPPEPPLPPSPEREALLQKLQARHAEARERIRRAMERPGPGITDADIEAEFERVRLWLRLRDRAKSMTPDAGAEEPAPHPDAGSGRGGAQ